MRLYLTPRDKTEEKCQLLTGKGTGRGCAQLENGHFATIILRIGIGKNHQIWWDGRGIINELQNIYSLKVSYHTQLISCKKKKKKKTSKYTMEISDNHQARYSKRTSVGQAGSRQTLCISRYVPLEGHTLGIPNAGSIPTTDG